MEQRHPKPASNSEKGSFLWEVKGGNAKMYLAGTVHIVPESFFPLKKELIRKFDECDSLVLEVILDTSEENAPEITEDILNKKEYTYEDGDSLYNHFPKEKIMKLRNYMVKHKLCPPSLYKKFYKLRPEVVNSMLFDGMCKRAGLSLKNMGIDHYFLNRAREMGKRLLELESKEFQQEILALYYGDLGAEKIKADPSGNLPKDLPKEHTKETLAIIEDGLIGRFMRLRFLPWLIGSYAERVGSLYGNEEKVRRAREKAILKGSPLFGSRDENMCKRLLELLRTRESYFVAVGAAHLIGENSIVDRLRKQGFMVNRIC